MSQFQFHYLKLSKVSIRTSRRLLEQCLAVLIGYVYGSPSIAADITPSASSSTPNVLIVQYPKMADEYRRDFDPYFLKLLTLALQKADVAYEFEGVELPVMVESRSAEYLKAQTNMVHWLNASAERQATLIPIKIPLFKGLIGWRVFFIRPEDQAKFLAVDSKEALEQFVAGQGHDWPDTKVLRSNGLNVRALPSWRGLFEMLQHGRIDYLPRSIIEVEREQRLFSSLNLYVETSLALHYPAAYYFFVNQDNTRLANAIDKGLRLASEDGSFDALFDQYFADIVRRARLSERKVIQLENTATTYFPVSEKEFWLFPPVIPPKAH